MVDQDFKEPGHQVDLAEAVAADRHGREGDLKNGLAFEACNLFWSIHAHYSACFATSCMAKHILLENLKHCTSASNLSKGVLSNRT